MKYTALLLATFLTFVCANADNEALLRKLDETIGRRKSIQIQKQEDILYLKSELRQEREPQLRLNYYYKLIQQYYIYQPDSAQTYINRGMQLARELHDTTMLYQLQIDAAALMGINGLYAEAEAYLEKIDTAALSAQLKFHYHYTLFEIYSYWSTYCSDTCYSPTYLHKALQHIRQAYPHLHPDIPGYHYYLADYYAANQLLVPAEKYYLKAFNESPEFSRFKASAAYSLSTLAKARGQKDIYLKYLIHACIADVKGLFKESAGLQELATYLFTHRKEELHRAQQYISLYINNSNSSKNRLRMMQAARVYPTILTAYQKEIQEQNQRLNLSLIACILLTSGLLVYAYLNHRKSQQLQCTKAELAQVNTMLQNTNGQLQQTNETLTQQNEQLLQINKKREKLAKIYIDLCYYYIQVMKKYELNVKRKILAHKEKELLKGKTRLYRDTAENAVFLNQFDEAFLDLYPTFVTEYNRLLLPEYRNTEQQPNTLTIEQRIFALQRLGVKNSIEIAHLLSYSVQTIYNYRSEMKNKVSDIKAFEAAICQIS